MEEKKNAKATASAASSTNAKVDAALKPGSGKAKVNANALTLEQIRADMEGCARCELHAARSNIVFGSGNPHARVMIIGEAPGKREDASGEPFAGATGRYLDELLSLAKLKREDVFIANVVKCRPPSNRDPRPEEIQACSNFLRAQTRAVDPEYLVTLGNFATKFILKTDEGISSLRGTVQFAGKFTVFPVFHPAAALYDPGKREVLEEDFVRLGQLLGNE